MDDNDNESEFGSKEEEEAFLKEEGFDIHENIEQQQMQEDADELSSKLTCAHFEERQKKQPPKQLREPFLDEKKEFVRSAKAKAISFDYPAPEAIIGLTEIVHEIKTVFDEQIAKSGYLQFKDAQVEAAKTRIKEKKEQNPKLDEGKAIDDLLQGHDLRRLYKLGFDKACNPDPFLNETLLAFNRAKFSLASLYRRNGLMVDCHDKIREWIEKISYGASEKETFENKRGRKVIIAELVPHSEEYIIRNAKLGALFLVQSAIDQLAKFPSAAHRRVLEYKTVNAGGKVIKEATSKLVYDKTIETPNFEGDFATHKPDLERTVLLLEQSSKVLSSLRETVLSGAVKHNAESIDALLRSNDFFDPAMRGALVTDLFETLAYAADIPFNRQKAYALQELSGEKISMVVRAAKLYNEKLQEIITLEGVDAGQPYFLEINEGHRTILGADIKGKKSEDINKKLLREWTTTCFSDKDSLESFLLSATYTDHPAAYISGCLEAFGIPEKSAKEFENLFAEFLFRGKTPEELVDIAPEKRPPRRVTGRELPDVYTALVKDMGEARLAQSLRFVMEELSGKNLVPFYATAFVKKNNASRRRVKVPERSQGIHYDIITYGRDKELDLLQVDRINFHRGDTATLNRRLAAYPEHDNYIGGNLGVAWILDIDMGWPKNPEWSKIEVLLDKTADKDKTPMEILFDNLQVDFHETRHIGQIGSRLKWRYVAAHVAEFFADYCLKKYSAGALDKETVFTDFSLRGVEDIKSKDQFSSKLRHPITLREHILKWFKIFNATALGTGGRAELLRQHGPYKGALLYDENGNPSDPRKYAIRETDGLSAMAQKRSESIIQEGALLDVISSVQIESSETAELAERVFNAIKNIGIGIKKPRTGDEVNALLESGSRESLEKLLCECRRAKQEFSTIIETDAEVSGLYCAREALRNAYAGDDVKLTELDDAYQQRYNALVHQGIIGKKADEIFKRYDKNHNVTSFTRNLKKLGLKYSRVYDSEEATKTVPANLKKLGFESHDKAYENPKEVKKRLRAYNKSHPNEQLKEEDVLMPTNMPRIDIQKRYRAHIPAFMSIVETHGYQKAVEIFEKAECVEDVIKYK